MWDDRKQLQQWERWCLSLSSHTAFIISILPQTPSLLQEKIQTCLWGRNSGRLVTDLHVARSSSFDIKQLLVFGFLSL